MGFELVNIIAECLNAARKEFKGSDSEYKEKLKEKYSDILGTSVKIFSEGLLTYYKTKLIDEIRSKENYFIAKLFLMYQEGFNKLQIFVDLNRYLGQEIVQKGKSILNPDDKIKFMVLVGLHARACQVLGEIQTLVKNGFADGAFARWRTLHELSVIFNVLHSHDAGLSKMYNASQIVQRYNRAKTFQIHNSNLKWKPINDQTIGNLKVAVERLEVQYGREFIKEYGWTMNILAKNDRNFKGLEELAGFDSLRPFYQWASNTVHSGAEAISERMGIIDVSRVPYLTLSQQTLYGFADPIQFSTYSMIQMTAQLISYEPSLENEVIETMIEDLHSEIFESIIKVQKNFEKEIDEIG